MYFWDICDLSDKGGNAQFHILELKDKDPEETPIVSCMAWTANPMLVTAGKAYQVRIWSPSAANETQPQKQNTTTLPETVPAKVEQVRLQILRKPFH